MFFNSREKKNWNAEHDRLWSPQLVRLPNNRTIFQETTLEQITAIFSKNNIGYNVIETQVLNRENIEIPNQMIKVEIQHKCLKDCYIYHDQADFTNKESTYHFEFWGYQDPKELTTKFVQDIEKKINKCV